MEYWWLKDRSTNKISLLSFLKRYISHNWRTCIYTLCALGLCWVDLWRAVGNGAQWALAVNCIGFCIFPMILLRLDWKILFPNRDDNVKWHRTFRLFFYGWIVFFAVCAYPVFRYLAPGTDYNAQIATAILNVGLYGTVSLRMYFYLFYEKNSGQACETNLKISGFFWLWFAFIVLAVASVNRSLWPFWFMVMFGAFYLAPIEKDELNNIADGIATGMIIGFFWIQGRAFLYRPYDVDFRYYGQYTNPNVNAMFYLFTYIAWLTKLSFLRIRRFRLMYLFAFFMASSMWVFAFFTGCRSVWLAMAGVTIVYLVMESQFLTGRKLTVSVGRFLAMCVCAIAAFFPVFICMRYIPPLRHHPIWYQGEYSENRVMSWDPIDSPKYMELGEVLDGLLGRVNITQNYMSQQSEYIHPSYDDLTFIYAASITSAGSDSEGNPLFETEVYDSANSYSEDGTRVYRYSDGVPPGTDPDHPIYIREDYSGSLLRKILSIRYYIYGYVLENIHLFGNESNGIGIWLTDYFELYHAHNSVLQMMYWFGSVAGSIFLLLLLTIPINGLKRIFKADKCKASEYVSTEFSVLIIIGYLLASLMECLAFPGENGLTLMFIAIIFVIRKNDSIKSFV